MTIRTIPRLRQVRTLACLTIVAAVAWAWVGALWTPSGESRGDHVTIVLLDKQVRQA